MTPVLAFDIETIPDCAGLRRLHGLPDSLDDGEVAEIAFQRRRARTGSDFLPTHLHRVLVISCVLRSDDGVQVFSIGAPERDEQAAIRKFHDGIERLVPRLVSWNGGGFDLPVLNYRALVCGLVASRFWEQGEDDRDFRYNNYVNRYHDRHLDLMDVLAMYQPRNNAPLDEVARLAGFPGKLGMDGSAVWAAYREGRIDEIRAYCEADAANTYLLYLRFQQLRGHLEPSRYEAECRLFRDHLAASSGTQWKHFLERWDG